MEPSISSSRSAKKKYLRDQEMSILGKCSSDQDEQQQTKADTAAAPECVRERLKKHSLEMAGRVWIPETWGQESLLKDWVDCSAFDSSLVPKGLIMARDALVDEGRRTAATTPPPPIRVEERCLPWIAQCHGGREV